jgi:hypothetical protein
LGWGLLRAAGGVEACTWSFGRRLGVAELEGRLRLPIVQACEELGDAISAAGDKDFALKVYQQCGAGPKVRARVRVRVVRHQVRVHAAG